MNFPVFCLQESINTKMANWQKAVVNGFLLCYLQGFFCGGGGCWNHPHGPSEKSNGKTHMITMTFITFEAQPLHHFASKKSCFFSKGEGAPPPLRPLPHETPPMTKTWLCAWAPHCIGDNSVNCHISIFFRETISQFCYMFTALWEMREKRSTVRTEVTCVKVTP